MTPRVSLLVVFFHLFVPVQSQIPDTALYNQREAEIDLAVEEEDYERAAQLLESQIEYLQSTANYDSLYKYLYNYGRSLRKTEGAATSVNIVEELLGDVFEHDPDTLHWLKALENMSSIYYEAGESENCAKVDRQYLDLVNQYSRANAKQKSTGYYNVGYNELEAGRSSDAVVHFRKSVEVLDTNDINSVRRLVNSYNALGAGLWRNGDLVNAKSTFRTCLRFIDQLEDEYVLLGNRSNCLGNLSLIYQDEGQLITAKKILLEGIEERKKAIAIGDDPFQNDQHRRMLISNFRNLASIYLGMGDHARALHIVRQLQKMEQDMYEPGHPRLALTDESFGSIYLAMEKFDKAEEYLNKYLGFCNGYYGRESFITADAYKRMGDIHIGKSNFPGAIEALNEAIDIFAVISGNGSHHSLPGCYAQRSWCHQQLGEPQRALADNQKSIDLLHQLREEDDPKLGEAYVQRAKLYREHHRLQQAEESIDKALSILRNYRNAVQGNNPRLHQDPVLFLPDAYFEKAKITEKKSADANLIEIAHYLDSSISILRNTKTFYEGEDAQLGLYGDHQTIFEWAKDICFQQYKTTNDQKHVRKMLALNEESRTLLLRRQLQGFGSMQFYGVPDTVLTEEKVLLAQLNGRVPLDTTFNDYQQIEQKYIELKKYIHQNYPEYFKLRFSEGTVEVDEIRSALLGDDHTLLQYIATDQNLYALIITPDSIHLSELPAKGIDHLVDRFNHFIQQMEVEPFAQVSVGLYRVLIEPIEKFLSTPNILVIPDEQLFSINFETLIRPSKSEKPQYLIYNYNISYLLSATTAVQFHRLDQQGTDGLLALAPGFSDQLKEQYLQNRNDSLNIDESYLRYLQQPFAERSAQNIASIMAGQSFTGQDATESRFKENANRFRIIHLGTHTQINNTSPLLSRLILAKDPKNNVNVEDGYLHAYEIYNLPLRAELAVLTACETGVGKEHPTEGVLSLSQSFAYAGCPSIVMSLWKIDEKTSSGIVESFYQHLSNGNSKSEALRQAKLEYLSGARGEMSAPYFWAGMVLLGNTDPVVPQSSRLFWWVLLVLILALIFAIFLRSMGKKTRKMESVKSHFFL